MATLSNTLFFSDFDYKFTAHPQTGRLTIKKNNDAITQAVKLLIMTNILERPFRPDLGSTIRSTLFDNFGPFATAEILDSITTAIQNIEPRVIILDVQAIPDPDNMRLDITLVYRPVNAAESVEANFSLERLK